MVENYSEYKQTNQLTSAYLNANTIQNRSV